MAIIPPTFITHYPVATWDTTTTPKTATATTSARDFLVVMAMSEDSTLAWNTPTGNSLTYTSRQSDFTAGWGSAQVWTTTDAAGAAGWTLSVTTNTTVKKWGFDALRFGTTTGYGTSAKNVEASGGASGGAPSLSITTTRANSAIAVCVVDFSAKDGTVRTWRTVNGAVAVETTYFRNSLNYTVYAGYYANAGAPGAKVVGLTAPTAQQYTIMAVEVMGIPAAGPPSRVVGTPIPAADRAANW